MFLRTGDERGKCVATFAAMSDENGAWRLALQSDPSVGPRRTQTDHNRASVTLLLTTSSIRYQ